MRSRLFFVAWVLPLTWIGATSTAEAFLCARVPDADGEETGPGLAWETREVPFTLYAAGTNDLAGAEEFDILRLSFARWGPTTDLDGAIIGQPVQECALPQRFSDISFVEAPTTSNRDRVGYDYLHPEQNENLLIFRDDHWPHPAQVRLVVALTTTTFTALGEIFDADIEFNSRQVVFTGGDDFVQTDLMNTAVHEIGHFLGFAHSSIRDSTMYDSANLGEVMKRDLHCDDRDALVFRYPEGEGIGSCDPEVEVCGGCAPAGELTQIPTVIASDHDNGIAGVPTEIGGTPGAGCRTVGAPWWGLWVLVPLVRRGNRGPAGAGDPT